MKSHGFQVDCRWESAVQDRDPKVREDGSGRALCEIPGEPHAVDQFFEIAPF